MSPILIVLLVVLAALVLAAGLRAVRRTRSVPRGAWVVLELKGPVSELPPRVPWFRRWLRPVPTAHSVVALRRLADRIAADARVEGVLLRLGEVSCGWATAASVRDVVQQLRSRGKRVVAYLPLGGQTRELYIALAAERVYTSPQASIAPIGVASAMTFYRALLARGGVDTDLLARREYKSAAEMFTRDGFSDANRHQISALLETLHGAVVHAIATARGRSEEEARALVDGAPFRAREAVERGLIDGLAYDDELPPLLAPAPPVLVKAGRYMAATAPWMPPGFRMRRGGPRVGIVEVRGAIVSEAPLAFGRVADVSRVTGALRAARRNRAIGAVVLYVDSPGGSALASDLIAREVARLREKKPVVAYFADTAASGGYYVAAPTQEIVAQPVTITGSIGVITLRFVFERTLAKLGLTHEVIRRGRRADMLSPYRQWTDDERSVLDQQIDAFYEDFVGVVARGRGRTPAEIEPLARGRVYSGRDAHAVGLVDHLGGLDVAVNRAAEIARLVAPGPPVVVHPPRELPAPPEPPAPLQPLVARLGLDADLLNLVLGAEHELLFAYEDRTL
jgi:protease-4